MSQSRWFKGQHDVYRWLTEKDKKTKEGPWLGFRRDVVISAVFAAGSIAVVGLLIFLQEAPEELVAAGRLIWMIWALAPPLYFMWEWANLAGVTTGPRFDTMRYNHELCAKFWVAGIGVISAALLAQSPPTIHMGG